MSKKLQPLCDLKLYIVETSPSNSLTRKHFAMPTRPARLLCVGRELELLQTRCAVLNQSGYDTLAATLAEAESILRVSEFRPRHCYGVAE